jgi:tetratricopeptide (TPR) repeat protein
LTVLPDQANLLFGLGASLERAGRFDESVETFEYMLAKYPDNAPGLNYLGYMLADAGIRLGEARKLIEQALKLDGDNGAYLDSHAWVLFRLGKSREAAEKIRQALEHLQSDAVVFEHYGDILADLGRQSEAQANWRKALELDPDNAGLKEKLKR